MIITETTQPLPGYNVGTKEYVFVVDVRSGSVNIQQLDGEGNWQIIHTSETSESFRCLCQLPMTAVEITGEATVRVY